MITNLNIITEYNNVLGNDEVKRSSIKIKDLVSFLQEKGIKSIGVKDNSMMSIIELYTKCTSVDIKPIIGLSIEVNKNKVVLYAKDKVGYNNLMYIHSIDNLMNGITSEEILKNSEGIICVYQSENDLFKEESIKELKNTFNDDFYMEISSSNDYNKVKILELIDSLNLKYILGNDVQTLNNEKTDLPNILKTIKDQTVFDDPNNQIDYSLNYFSDFSEFFSEDEINNACNNEIDEKCQVELKLGDPTPPKFKFTKEYAQKEGLEIDNDEEYFVHKCKEGLKERLVHVSEEKHEEYRKRLEYEMDIINSMKFPGYMLIVWDFIAFARSKGIPVGPGRGSAAGSLVAYCLYITDLDPIPYGLLFERFLNPERVSMPDVDIDFCQSRRGEVINYVVDKYGKTQVAQVATFGTLLAKGALKDVSRSYGLPYSLAEQYAKLIPDELNITLETSLEKKKEISDKLEEDRTFKRVWDTSLALEGVKRNSGMHAAGVVISNEELWKKTPVFLNDMGGVVTEYSLDYLEPVDLIKFDFLGLKTLTVIDNAVKMIKKNHGKDINVSLLDLNDKNVLDYISSGATIGMFQIESSGMRDLAKRLKPSSFEDVIAMLALYRPGPMESGMLDDFIDRKHGIAEINYFFDEMTEALKPILEATYGVIVYQEQVMQIVQAIGGFSLGGSDIIRRAMGKKKVDVMLKYRKEFAEQAQELGYDYEKAEKLFILIEKFAGYGFNKSHSAAYAMVTMITAWLKYYYPNEFMASLISSVTDNKDKMALYLSEVKTLGINLITPDVNISKNEFIALKNGDMLFGLSGIKGVGDIAIENIESLQPFSSLTDFLHRTSSKVNKSVIHNLALVGGFKHLNEYRKTIIENIEYILDYQKELSVSETVLKEGLFSDSYEEFLPTLKLSSFGEYEEEEILNMEKELLGFYLSGHPLDIYKSQIEQLETDYLIDINDDELLEAIQNGTPIKKKFSIIGKIDNVVEKMSKKGNVFGIMTLIDFHSSRDFLIFSNLLEELKEIDLEKPVRVEFEVDIYNEKLSFKIRNISSWKKIREGKKISKPQEIDYVQEYKQTQINKEVKKEEKIENIYSSQEFNFNGQDYIIYSNNTKTESEVKELIAL